tara:strand:+ start:818 stop:1495 length:678 start_codon:yes stop_codon:yes gene_type:complete
MDIIERTKKNIPRALMISVVCSVLIDFLGVQEGFLSEVNKSRVTYSGSVLGTGNSTLYTVHKKGVLYVEGEIGTGYAHKVRSLLLKYSAHTLVLDSTGGYLKEAYDLAGLVSLYGINTHVTNKCSSACGIIYLAGYRRTADKQASFGFHSTSGGSTTVNKKQNNLMCNYYSRRVPSGRICNAINDTSSKSMTYLPMKHLLSVGWLDNTSNKLDKLYPLNFSKLRY